MVKGIAQMKHHFAAHMHGTKQIRRLFQSLAAYFPQEAGISGRFIFLSSSIDYKHDTAT
jgi:hypothetical protein